MFSSIRLTLVCCVFFCGVYTFIVFGFSKLVPHSMAFIKNKDGFYENVGQAFNSDKYFWSRPSAVNYNAAGSAGSNKGPSNPNYLSDVKARIDTFLAHNPGIKKQEIPSDLVTASGSGLDPHISFQAAKIQIKRIAKVRNIQESTLLELITQNIEKPLFGIFGIEKINVLNLNQELDQLTKN